MWDQFHYGVCYFPEHWDSSRWESDIKRIAACGFNFVRMAEGAWSYFEPEEGEFQFDLFDRVIDLCRRKKIKVIMGTPTYCAPAWVSHRYPEVLRWNFDRIPMAHGSRRNFSYSSAKYNELSDRIVTALAQHYKGEEQIIAWQLDNEFNCHMDVSYSPSDTAVFRVWLREKYKTLDRLNHAWGTAFWSQTYSDWEQIDLPHPTAAYMNPHQMLDESRFISDMVVRFARRQADILRRHNRRWQITHNALFANVNGPDLVKVLDFFSHDQYPLFYKEGEWAGWATNLQQARSLSFPYGVLEQQSGPGGQMTYFHRTARPGQMRLWAWQSILHGAKLLSYFRWRTCPYGAEQHWHGLLDADDRDNRRIAEAKRVGVELKKMPAGFFDAPTQKCVGILRDYDNEVNERRINTYPGEARNEQWKWAEQCSIAHIPADFIWAQGDGSPTDLGPTSRSGVKGSRPLPGYKIVVAPHLKIATRDVVKKLTTYVESGGVLVLGAQSGLKDANLHIVEAVLPGLFRKLAGVEVEEWSTLPKENTCQVRTSAGQILTVHGFAEKLKPRSAEVLGKWIGDDGLLSGGVAMTRNRVGKGYVYYIGGYCPPATIGQLLALLRESHGIEPIVQAGPEVEAIARGDGKQRYISLLNHSPKPQIVRGLLGGRDLIGGKRVVDGQMVLDGYELAVVAM